MSDPSGDFPYRAFGVSKMAVWSIVNFKVLPKFKIEVAFADGTAGVADLSPRLTQGPVGDGFDPLCDEEFFSRVCIEHGALTWPGGIDLAPDTMYQRIQSSGTSILAAKVARVAQANIASPANNGHPRTGRTHAGAGVGVIGEVTGLETGR